VKPKQLLTYAIIAFAVWWVIQQPTNAAHLIHNVGTLLSSAATGLSNFITKI
jgi:hypothetical protein